jgi:hypothetical protein
MPSGMLRTGECRMVMQGLPGIVEVFKVCPMTLLWQVAASTP